MLAAPRPRALGTFLLAALAALLAAASLATASASADTGYLDHNFGSSGALTGNKESKLWYTSGGQWWSILTPAGGGGLNIHRLDKATHKWVNTGVVVSSSSSNRPDVLFDASINRLYVAVHAYTDSNAAGTGAKLLRYDFNGSAYTKVGTDATFNGYKTETLTIDKDSGGLIWATWVQAGKVYVNHTVGGDATWGSPYQVPGTPTVKTDDISSIIHFGSSIGVMFSNQLDTKTYFSVHPDGAAEGSWTTSVVPTGGTADDHFSLRALGDGTVYAATKTSDNSSSKPMIVALKRAPAGTWTSAVFGYGSDSHTRPMVLIDTTASLLHVFATGPNKAIKSSGQAGGIIAEKTSPLGTLSFASGVGTPVIKDDDSARINDATSTKQNVTSASGIVVAASDKDADTYWHAESGTGGGTGGGPAVPAAAFTSAATPAGSLTWTFTNTSTGATSYSWNFGDGATSSATSPSHAYAAAGTYLVKLTATNGAGSTVAQQSITVAPQGGGTGGGTAGTTTLTPIADAYVKSNSVSKAYGTATTMQLRLDTSATGSNYIGLVKFNLATVSGTVTSAKLRLFVTDASKNAGSVFTTASSWAETVTYATRPAQGSQVGVLGATPATGSWEEVDVTGAVTPGGLVSFALPGGGTDSAIFATREAGANAPQLVITTSL